MSSESPAKNEKCDVCVVGSGWEAAYASYLLSLAGVEVVHLERPPSPESPTEIITVGNGDLLRRAELALGETLARELWAVSKKNTKRAKQLFEKLGLAYQPVDVYWLSASAFNPDASRESGIAFQCDALRVALQTASKSKVKRLTGEAASFAFPGQGAEVRAKTPQGEKRILGERVFLLEDETILKLSPSMKEELIPVTLSLFEERAEDAAPRGYFLFHGGADFAYVEAGKILMGSFRNLYADKAVGFLQSYDPATWKGVSQFFSERGWVKPLASPSRPCLKRVSLSCDGLPLAGPLRDYPSVFVATCFAGRTANFQFEVLPQLVDSLIRGTAVDSPLSSNRRFL